MAHKPFRVDVLTPTGELFAGEVEQVSTRTVAGEIGILAGHAPLLGRLEPAELKLYQAGGEVQRFVQVGGYVQVAQDGDVLLLVDEAYPAEQYSVEDAKQRQSDAEARLAEAAEGSEAHRLAVAGKRRADALVRLAERL